MAKSIDPERDNLLTVEEAARRLACSTRSIWRLMDPEEENNDPPELDRVEIRGMTRTTEESVQRLIARGKKKSLLGINRRRKARC